MAGKVDKTSPSSSPLLGKGHQLVPPASLQTKITALWQECSNNFKTAYGKAYSFAAGGLSSIGSVVQRIFAYFFPPQAGQVVQQPQAQQLNQQPTPVQQVVQQSQVQQVVQQPLAQQLNQQLTQVQVVPQPQAQQVPKKPLTVINASFEENQKKQAELNYNSFGSTHIIEDSPQVIEESLPVEQQPEALLNKLEAYCKENLSWVNSLLEKTSNFKLQQLKKKIENDLLEVGKKRKFVASSGKGQGISLQLAKVVKSNVERILQGENFYRTQLEQFFKSNEN